MHVLSNTQTVESIRISTTNETRIYFQHFYIRLNKSFYYKVKFCRHIAMQPLRLQKSFLVSNIQVKYLALIFNLVFWVFLIHIYYKYQNKLLVRFLPTHYINFEHFIYWIFINIFQIKYLTTLSLRNWYRICETYKICSYPLKRCFDILTTLRDVLIALQVCLQSKKHYA